MSSIYDEPFGMELVDIVKKTIVTMDEMEKVNALCGRDVMAATCIVISNNLRNALYRAGLRREDVP